MSEKIREELYFKKCRTSITVRKKEKNTQNYATFKKKEIKGKK